MTQLNNFETKTIIKKLKNIITQTLKKLKTL